MIKDMRKTITRSYFGACEKMYDKYLIGKCKESIHGKHIMWLDSKKNDRRRRTDFLMCILCNEKLQIVD